MGRVFSQVIARPVSLFFFGFCCGFSSGVPKEENDGRLSQPTASLGELTDGFRTMYLGLHQRRTGKAAV